MALSENYRTETIGWSDCRPIVRLSADTIVRWDYRPNPNFKLFLHLLYILFIIMYWLNWLTNTNHNLAFSIILFVILLLS